MKLPKINVALLTFAFALSACGPASWNQQAEYLAAPKKSDAELENASIEEYIADLPPSKIFSNDPSDLRTRLKNATIEHAPEWSRITLAASQSAPKQVFLFNRKSRLIRVSVNSSSSEWASEVHMFQRKRSYWHHWIEVNNH